LETHLLCWHHLASLDGDNQQHHQQQQQHM
jgi:hypothetical protein